jgi:hypothetical protein
MRVKMRTTAAGPDGVLQAGQTVNLPAEKTKAFIDGGYAEEVVLSQVELATAEPKEKATAPAQAKRTRPKAKPKAEV